MPPVTIALFAACSLLIGFGAYQILSFAQASRRTSAITAIVVALVVFGGTTVGFAHGFGHPTPASVATARAK